MSKTRRCPFCQCLFLPFIVPSKWSAVSRSAKGNGAPSITDRSYGRIPSMARLHATASKSGDKLIPITLGSTVRNMRKVSNGVADNSSGATKNVASLCLKRTT